MLEHQVTDNGVIMETDDEKISARIKMIDETEVTQSAQALTTQPQLHHLLQSGSSGFRVFNFTVACIAVAATVISCSSLDSMKRDAGRTDVPESDSKQRSQSDWTDFCRTCYYDPAAEVQSRNCLVR